MTSTPRWIRALAASALCLALCACGQEPAPPEPPAQAKASSEAERAEANEAAAQAEADAVRALVGRLITDVVSQNYEAAARQFHIDPAASPEIRAQEETKIAALLWAVNQKLGALQDTAPLARGAAELETFGLRVRSGSEAYWATYDSDAEARTVMLARFANAESAQIALELVRDSSGWKVSELDLGLPVATEGSEDQLREIAELAAKRLAEPS